MKIFGLVFAIGLLLSGCAGRIGTAPTPTLPAFSPVALAQTTNAPTPTADPRFTATPTLTAVPVATTLPTTPAPLATQAVQVQTPAVVGKIALFDLPGEGRAPNALTLLNDAIYVTNRETKNLAVIEKNRATQYIALDAAPSAVTADAGRNRVYVGTSENPTLYVVQDGKIAAQTKIAGRINALAFHNDRLYVALDSDPIIERYDANTLTKLDQIELSQGFAVDALTLDAARNRLYAGIYGKIVALDLEKFQELFTLDAPYLIGKFSVNPNDGSVWAGAYDEAALRAYIIGYASDGKEITRTYMGADLVAATFDNADNLYVLDQYNNKVHVVHTPDAQERATVAVNQDPSDAVFDSKNNIVWVANTGSDNVSALQTASLRVINTIPLAANITALTANPERKRVYAASGSTNSVLVIENDKVIGEVGTGNHPIDLAVDPMSNRVYVASLADGVMTVIDESSLEIRATEFITRFLSTTAVDPGAKKLFAGSFLLNPETLDVQATFFANGMTLDSKTIPQFERVNPAARKVYAVASNGIPGSNGRLTLFRFLYDDLNDSKMLGSRNNGNTTALAIDPTTGNLYATNTHPLAYTHGLDVFDEQDNLVQSLVLNSHTTDLEVNPETHHLFLSHAFTYSPPGYQPLPVDDSVEILDTRTLGQVTTIAVPGTPWRMTRLNDKLYVASLQNGALSIVQDVATQKPAAPTPTLTPTPFPTWTPAPNLPATPTAPSSVNVACSFGPPIPFAELWLQYTKELGCPTDVAAEGNFAVQTFAGGYMFDDLRNPNAQKIYVLLPDHTFEIFDDTWREGEEERPCNDVKIPEGRIHPKRGFGKVWCENVALQTKLPGAVADESGITLNVQDFERGMMWANTPQGVITLFENGTWQ